MYMHLAICSTDLFLNLCSSLDPQLQKALKEYLVARGIGEELTHFLIEHLHRKEHGQYVNWLRTLEGAFAKDAWHMTFIKKET